MNPEDLALAVLRISVGGVYLAHGLRKLGVGDPHGFAGFRASITRRGYRPALPWAAMAVGAEVVGGILAVLGLLTVFAGAALFAQSLMILVVSAPRGFWHDQRGVEYPILLTAASIGVTLLGPGGLSLDHGLGLTWDGWVALAAIAVAALGVGVGLVTRKPAG
jgi:putative oxidoreductase